MKSQARIWSDALDGRRPDEVDCKELLRAYGIACPRGRRIAADASESFTELRAPLAVKVCAADIIHKSELGGVILDVDHDGVTIAIATIAERFPGRAVLVEEQLSYVAPELIVGALVDDDFGAAVMVGRGGVLTELYRDVGFRLAPCAPSEARRMVDELAIAGVFRASWSNRLDADGLADAVARISQLAVDLGPALAQLDINPLVFTATGFVAVDAVLVLADDANHNQSDSTC